MKFLTVALLFAAFSTMTSVDAQADEEKVPNTFQEGDRSLYWNSCNASNMYNSGWHSVHTCMSIYQFMKDDPTSLEANTTGFCDSTFTTSNLISANGTLLCTPLAEAMVAAYWCHLGVGGNASVSTMAMFNTSISHPELHLLNASSCIDTNAALGWSQVTEAISLLNAAPNTVSLRLGCYAPAESISLSSCDGSYGNLNTLWPTHYDNQCRNGFEMQCTVCQPYLQKDTLAQPYFFLAFPAIKLVIVVLLKLFVFNRLNEVIREKVVLYNTELEPLDELPFDDDFVHFIIKHVLHSRRWRIKMRETMKTLNGINFLKKLLKLYNSQKDEQIESRLNAYNNKNQPTSNKDDDDGEAVDPEKEPTVETIKSYVGPDSNGILRQHATLRKTKGMTNFMNVMHPYWGQVIAISDDQKHHREKSRLAAALREEEDWYWEHICEFGRHWYHGQRSVLEDYFRDVWQTHLLPSMDFHKKHTSRDVSDDRNVIFREVYWENDTRHPQFVVECELDDTWADVHHAMCELVKEFDPTKAHEDHTHMQFFKKNGERILLLGEEEKLRTVQELEEMDPTLTFRFAFIKNPIEAQPCEFESLKSIVNRKREALKDHTKDNVTCTRFSHDTLFEETKRTLTSLLDPRGKTALARTALVMAGEEVMSACDAAIERYEIRDSIEPVKGILELEEKMLEEKKAAKKEEKEGKMSKKQLHKKKKKEAKKQQKQKKKEESAVHESKLGAYMAQSKNEPVAGGADGFDTCDVEVDAQDRADLVKAIPETPSNAAMLHDAAVADKLAGVDEADITPTNIRLIYNEVYDEITKYTRYDGKRIPGAAKVYERDLPAVQELLTECWENITDALIDANDDPFAVDEKVFVAIYEERLKDIATIIEIQPTAEMIFQTMYNINVYILLFQLIFGIIFFATSTSDAVDSLSPRHSDWDRYELTYFRFMNSGTPVSLLFAACSNIASGGRNRATSYFYKAADFIALTLALLLIIAPVTTHIVPACFIFIWVLIATIVVFSAPSAILFCVYKGLSKKWNDRVAYSAEEILKSRQFLKKLLTGLFLWNQFTIIIVCTLVFQTAYNWGLLFYRAEREELTYLGVIEYELFARTTQCYLSQVFAQNSNVLQFFSSFVG